MEYKFKPIHLKVKDPKDMQFPNHKDRIIEKRGHVVEFSISDMERNTEILKKNKKEIEAKRDFEKAKMDNIEHFHAWVKRMSEERLHTAWLYFEAKGMVGVCNEKLKEIDKQLLDDEAELAEIKKQIPELNVAPVVEEAVQMLNDEQKRKNQK